MSKYTIDNCDVLVDLRKFDLADRIGKDLISVDALLTELENAYDKIEILQDEIAELQQVNDEDPDAYDRWLEHQLERDEQ